MDVPSVERTLTELDHARLTKLVEFHKCGSHASAATLPIERVLEDAERVAWRDVPPYVITMRSRVLLKDMQTGTQRTVTLCYPDGSDADAGLVSVLSPLGWSLLGQRVGGYAHWPTLAGATQKAQILSILFQPASSGILAK